MIVLHARNANQMLPEVMRLLTEARSNPSSGLAVERNSRNGKVLQFTQPTTFHYTKPRERVMFWPERDANPFFHLFECLWLLAGRNDVAPLKKYNSKIGDYSDDGVTFHGAYGHRWRRHFGLDQLKNIANTLRTNPEDRRQVLQMWDPSVDGNGREGKDFPCNLSVVFNRDSFGALDMTVYNRSNDIVWGALGANCVQFSFLQEFLATWIGCPVGQYWQVSANMHCYEWNSAPSLLLGEKAAPSMQVKVQCPYFTEQTQPTPIVNTDIVTWQDELVMFLAEGSKALGYRDSFFSRVCSPIFAAYESFRDKSDPHRFVAALDHLSGAIDCDWKLACSEWLLRRQAKANQQK